MKKFKINNFLRHTKRLYNKENDFKEEMLIFRRKLKEENNELYKNSNFEIKKYFKENEKIIYRETSFQNQKKEIIRNENYIRSISIPEIASILLGLIVFVPILLFILFIWIWAIIGLFENEKNIAGSFSLIVLILAIISAFP